MRGYYDLDYDGSNIDVEKWIDLSDMKEVELIRRGDGLWERMC